MIVVIADASPLNHLALMGETAILPRRYGQVFIPRFTLESRELAGLDS